MECRAHTFYVGQALTNVIEVYDDNQLINLSIIDCGVGKTETVIYPNNTVTTKSPPKEDVVSYIKNKMQERYTSSGNLIRLDNLFISHCDQDHWCLFNKIFNYEKYNILNRNKCSVLSKIDKFLDPSLEAFYFGKFQVVEGNNVEFLSIGYTYEYHNDFIESVATCTFFNNGPTVYSITSKLEDETTLITLDAEIEKNEGSTCFKSCYFKYFIDIDEEPSDTDEPSISASIYSTMQRCCELIIFNRSSGEQIQVQIDENDPWVIVLILLSKVNESCFENKDDKLKKIISILEIYKEHPIDPNSILKLLQSIVSENKSNYFCIKNTYIGGNIQGASKSFNEVYKKIIKISESVITSNFDEPCCLFKSYLYITPVIKLGVDSVMESTNPVKNNATSLVLALSSIDSYSSKMVYPGDATIQTFSVLLQKMQASKQAHEQQLLLNASWIAPHHGSNNTLELYTDAPNEIENNPFYQVLVLTKAKNMIISSGVGSLYGLPNIIFCNFMKHYYKKTTIVRFPQHNIFFFKSKKSAIIEDQTDIPLFTLSYCYKKYTDIIYDFKEEWPTPFFNDNAMHYENTMSNAIRDESLDTRQADLSREKQSKPCKIPASNLFFRRV